MYSERMVRVEVLCPRCGQQVTVDPVTDDLDHHRKPDSRVWCLGSGLHLDAAPKPKPASEAEVRALYDEARAANQEVSDTQAAYEAATRRRANLVRDLRDAGQSLSMIATMLDISRSRVNQLIGDGPKRRAEDAG